MSKNYGRDFEDSKRSLHAQSVISAVLTVVIVGVSLVLIILGLTLMDNYHDYAQRPYNENSLLYSVDQPHRLAEMTRKNMQINPSLRKGEMVNYYALGEYFDNRIIAEAYEAVGNMEKAAKFDGKANAVKGDIGPLETYAKNIEVMLDE